MVACILFLVPLISSGYFGVELISFLLHKYIDHETRILLGSIFGIHTLSLAFYMISIVVKLDFAIGLCISFIFFMIGFIIHLFSKPSQSQAILHRKEYILTVVIPTFFVSFIIFNGTFTTNSQVTVSQYESLLGHISFINSLIYGVNNDDWDINNFTNPEYSKTAYANPILPDILSASLVKCFDCPVHTSIVIPSLIYVYASFFMFARLCIMLSSSTITLYFSFLSFVFFGGRGYIFLTKPSSLADPNLDFISNWGNQRRQFCFHPIFYTLIGNRGALFSFPLALSLIILLVSDEFGKQAKFQIYILCSFIFPFLSLTDINAYYAMIVWCLLYSILQILLSSQPRKVPICLKWAYFFVSSITIRVAQYIGRMAPHEGTIILNPLWNDIEGSFLGFWNNGLHMFLIYSIFHGLVSLDKKQLIIFVPSLLHLVFAGVFRYQNNIYNNFTLLLYCFIPLSCMAIGNFLRVIWTKISSRSIIFFVLISLPLWSAGLMHFVHSSRFIQVFAHPYDANDVGAWIKENTEPNSIWISKSLPVNLLAGRQLLASYTNSSVALKHDESARLDAIDSIFANPDRNPLISKYSIDYVIVESSNAQILTTFIKSMQWELVMLSSKYFIFKYIV